MLTHTANFDDIHDSHVLAGMVTGRYGRLALTRAAGEAAAAERRGDQNRTKLWRTVIVDLRREMISAIGAP